MTSRYVQGHFIVEEHDKGIKLYLDTVQHPLTFLSIFTDDNTIIIKRHDKTTLALFKTQGNARLATAYLQGRDLVISIPVT